MIPLPVIGWIGRERERLTNFSASFAAMGIHHALTHRKGLPGVGTIGFRAKLHAIIILVVFFAIGIQMGLNARTQRMSFAYAIASCTKNSPLEARNLGFETSNVRGVIDTMGCVRGGLDAVTLTETRALAEAFLTIADSAFGSTLTSRPKRAMIEAATFVIGAAARNPNFSVIYLSNEASHPSNNIPSAPALAEALRVSGKRLCTALSVGYQAHCRIVDSVATRKEYWGNLNPGAIAASMSAGFVLDSNVERFSQRTSIAATLSAALMETRVVMFSKWKAAACASRAWGSSQALQPPVG